VTPSSHKAETSVPRLPVISATLSGPPSCTSIDDWSKTWTIALALVAIAFGYFNDKDESYSKREICHM